MLRVVWEEEGGWGVSGGMRNDERNGKGRKGVRRE